MRVAIVGTGAIGSTFAFQLARAGHEVTAIARGARLEQLARERAVVRSDGERAAVTVAAALDPAQDYDLVLVTVLAHQLAPLRAALAGSAARRVMFMFNTFESIAPLRELVGPARACFGFAGGVFTLLREGRITAVIRRGTTTDDPAWAEVFSAAGIPTVVDPQMQSWLRTHVAMVYPLMALGVLVHARRAGPTWAEARAHVDALRAGIAIVRAIGDDVRPRAIRIAAGLPGGFLVAMLWLLGRTQTLRDLGSLGAIEPRMLADMMHAARPELAAPVLAIRP